MYGYYNYPIRFVCKNSGVLFENQTLQIGIKSEFKKNLGEFINILCMMFIHFISLRSLWYIFW